MPHGPARQPKMHARHSNCMPPGATRACHAAKMHAGQPKCTATAAPRACYWLWLPDGPARQPKCMPDSPNACTQRLHGLARQTKCMHHGPANGSGCHTGLLGNQNACQAAEMHASRQRPHGPARQPTCMPISQSACLSLPHGPSPASTEHSTSHLDKQPILRCHAPVANG